jgi:hypothetical protein
MLIRLAMTMAMLLGVVMPFTTGAASVEANDAIMPTEWKLVGKGRFKFAFWSIYDASLYSQTGRFEPKKFGAIDQPIRLKLTYLRDIDKDELVDNTLDQWLQQGFSNKDIIGYKQTLLTTFPDVKENDHLAIEVSSQGSQFYYNDKKIEQAFSTEFGLIFSGIWLADNTTEPGLRNKLIGNN